jgi:hypothetical protein
VDRIAPAGFSLAGDSLFPLAPGIGDNRTLGPALSAIAPEAPSGLVRNDFNADGIEDLAKINDDSTVSVLLGRDDGTFEDGAWVGVGTLPKAIVTADFRGNGILDLVIANKVSRDVSVLLGRGDGTFEDELRFPIGGTGPDALFVGDFNGDDHLDLASVALENHELVVLLGNGDGTFQSPVLNGGDDRGMSLGMLLAAETDGEEFLFGGAEGSSRTSIGSYGQNLAQTLSLDSVSHSPASRAGSDDELVVYGRGEGQELAVLLTSFGIAVPSAHIEAERLPLADVFVVNGPGFTTAVEVFSQHGESPLGRDDVVAGNKGEPLSQIPFRSLKERSVFGSAEVDGVVLRDDASVDESALNSFQMILDDIFRPDRLDGLTGSFFGTAQSGPEPLPQSSEQAGQAPPPSRDGEPQLPNVLPEMMKNSEKTQADMFELALLAFGLWMGPNNPARIFSDGNDANAKSRLPSDLPRGLGAVR